VFHILIPQGLHWQAFSQESKSRLVGFCNKHLLQVDKHMLFSINSNELICLRKNLACIQWWIIFRSLQIMRYYKNSKLFIVTPQWIISRSIIHSLTYTRYNCQTVKSLINTRQLVYQLHIATTNNNTCRPP
jgi:hypothetical protein